MTLPFPGEAWHSSASKITVTNLSAMSPVLVYYRLTADRPRDLRNLQTMPMDEFLETFERDVS